MGVPTLFRYLQKKYSNITLNINYLKELTNIELYLDYNGIIHNATHGSEEAKLMLSNIERYEAIIKETCLIQDKISNEFTYIAIDGVAPKAKLYQQRNRRYKNFDETLSKSDFNSNVISPGTDFMIGLKEYMTNNISNCKVSYWDEVGEGEHKIMREIRNRPNNNPCVVHGLDADLIILSLITKMQTKKSIYLMREATEDTPEMVISIDNLYTSILTELKEFPNLKKNSDTNLMYTWIICGLFMGNDFLPPIPSLFIKEDAINNMLKVLDWKYTIVGGLLYENNQINYNAIENLLYILGRQEFKQFQYRYKKNEEYLNCEYIGFNCNTIKLNEEGYKKRYYFTKMLLDIEDFYDKKIILNMCKYYLLTIRWMIEYYEGNNISFQWNYPYYYAPFASDFTDVQRVVGGYKFNILPALSIEEQLKFILPVNDTNVEYSVDPNLQKEEWKGIILIP